MLKILSFLVFLCPTLCASAYASAQIPITHVAELTQPTVVAERPGVYVFRLSADIVASASERLREIFAPSTAELEKFSTLLEDAIYPHPTKLNHGRFMWKDFANAIRNLREILSVTEDKLPYYSPSKDENMTAEDPIISFSEHIMRSKAVKEAQIDPETLRQIIDPKLEEIRGVFQQRLKDYTAFYTARETVFRKYDIEKYVIALLGANTRAPIEGRANTILSILTETGCLEIQGTLYDNIFTYSPRQMVESYISKKGLPSKIVLGCGHANSHELLESLGLKSETWCGVCTKLPHADAMVISLDEPSADVLCDLNHPDLWTPISDGSVTAIHDETWRLNCYTPATLDQIARVLKVGGEFHSDRYGEGELHIKNRLIARGFCVVKEDKETNTLILRKIR